MALELKQNLKLSQQLLITPQLQQAIKLLQLSRFELENYLATQIEENPILEIQDSAVAEPDEALPELPAGEGEYQASDRVLSELEGNSLSFDGISEDVEASTEDSVITGSSDYIYASNSETPASNLESYTQYSLSLVDYLVDQVREVSFSPEEVQIALFIIGNLSSIGYLDLDVDAYCGEHNIDAELFAGVLDTIQRFDPPGIAARSLGECLHIQLRQRKIKNSLVELLIAKHLTDLANRGLGHLARELKVDISELTQAIAIIKTLEPRPARQFVSRPMLPVIPDVKVVKLSGQWRVVLNGEGLPNLRINPVYDRLSKKPQGEGEKSYWQEKHKAAHWLIKSVQQRQKTIFRVAECIVAKQRDFFEYGTQGLRPMILKDVAAEIGMHESTISRVTNNKYMATTRGTFELKYFFNNAVQGVGGEEHSSEAVKELIRDLLSSEDSYNPHSDEKIGKLLAKRGIKLARRTVAKYREQLGVQSSLKRKKYKEEL
jgi:RNA polymerase sigma-54 factor